MDPSPKTKLFQIGVLVRSLRVRFLAFLASHLRPVPLKAEPAPLETPPPLGGAARGSVLVIDDEQAVRDSLHKHMTEYFSVEAFTDIELALERLEEKLFDVVLLDLTSDETSLAVIGHLKQEYPALEIYIMTVGDPTSEECLECLQTGARGIITKPIGNWEDLITEMRILHQHKYWANKRAS